jgi:tetratricopeptide (TPR) repeat protein
MPRVVLRRLLLAAATGALGCASHPTPPAMTQPGPVVIVPTAPLRPADLRAEMPLDQVPPHPRLPAKLNDSSAPLPPIEAVQDFAQARIAMLDNERYTAINLLEKAAALDPDSFELNETLGQLYQGNATSDDRSIEAYERAAAIDPDHLDLQINLGRQYLASGKTSLGIRHLLLALQTTDYNQDDPAAAEVELFLSNALAQQGYARAAITLLERLSVRLSSPSMGMRSRPAMLLLLQHPEGVTLQIGTLEQKRGRYKEALAAYQEVARDDPDNVEVQGRIIQTLIAMGRHDEAADRAAGLVVQSQVREPSLSLLRESLRDAGGDLAVSDELGRLYQQHPRIRQLLFARLDLLHELGRGEAAGQVLADAAAAHPDDQELSARQFHALADRGDRAGAAALIIRITARHPEWTAESLDLFDELLRPSSTGRLMLADLRGLKLDPSEEAAQLYWIARYGMSWHRDGIARAAIERAVAAKPVFPPAYREQLEFILSRVQGNPTANPSADALARQAAQSDPSLAAELRGLILLRLNQPAEALQELAAAMRTGPNDAQVEMEYAQANSGNNDDQAFESAMWKLLSDHPTFDDGYLTLYSYYVARGSEAMCDRVLSTWLATQPDSVGALRLQVLDYFRGNRADAAEGILLRLMNSQGNDPDVLGTVVKIYSQTGKPEALPQKLEDRLAHDRGNFAAVSALADLYEEAHRPADVSRVLDASRLYEAHDPDVLYDLSSLYLENDQKDVAKDVLRQVLALDPTHAGASNDLGYFLAEQGQNLTQAQALIRRAVDAEPFNSSFLDSMGWVLYKLGRFAEAQKFLERAAGPDADPVVLDHLGDDQYRLGDKEAASKSWKQAGDRLLAAGDSRDDLKGLQQQLLQKQQELDAGRPVNVAPSTQPAATQPQADRAP